MADVKELNQITTEIDSSVMFTYVLAIKLDKRGKVFDENGEKRKDPEYPARRNILLRSSIVWPRNTIDPFSGKERSAGRHMIRYYDGCTSLFIDDQPKEKDAIDQLINSTREFYFTNGYAHLEGYDRMLILYMDWCSWNELSPYKVDKIDPIFKKLDAEDERKNESEFLDEMELAMENAKKADPAKMRIHAAFLDVPVVDYRTGQMLSDVSIRTEYRKAAKTDPARFNRTFNDKTMHLKFWIEKAIESGEISTTKIANRAVWAKKGVVIVDISGLTSHETILNKLIEFASTTDGSDFQTQLKSLYN